jgi:hypothetical protein
MQQQLVMDLPGGPRGSVAGESSKSPFLDVAQVASVLGWHPSTIRQNLVAIAEWKRGDATIPSVRLGGRYFIPRWWFEEVKRLGQTAPKDEEESGSVEKSTKSP